VPSTVDVFGTPARRPDLARPWAECEQRLREPPPCRSLRAGSGQHGDAAQRWRAHLAVDARAGEGAHRGAGTPLVAAALACSGGEDGGAGEENELGLKRAVVTGVFDRSRSTHGCSSPFDGRDRPVPHGLLLAQARRRFHGPGPGCFARCRERTQGLQAGP
jgi:hypothetical protein